MPMREESTMTPALRILFLAAIVAWIVFITAYIALPA
jgi:hypothetical protein